jgi:hypothetical protein
LDEELRERIERDVEGLAGYGERVGYLRAKLRLTRTEDGGRKGPVYSGYRSTWAWGGLTEDGLEIHHDASLTLESGVRLGLGEERTVRLYPIAPEFWAGLALGQRIEMREGHRVVGRGRAHRARRSERVNAPLSDANRTARSISVTLRLSQRLADRPQCRCLRAQPSCHSRATPGGETMVLPVSPDENW